MRALPARILAGLVLALAAAGIAAAQDSLAQDSLAQHSPARDYPARAVTLVVPQAPGGTNDIVARLLAGRLGEVMGGGRFIVENRAGAGGNVGTASAAAAPADGYTLLVTLSSTQAINPALYARVNFDPVRDFEPVSLLATVPNVLVAHPSFPAATLPELIALAKSRQGGQALQYASAGNGTLNHLLGEMLRVRAGIPLEHVPYRGVAPAINDMVGGHIQLGFASLPSAASYLRAGALKALAVSSEARSPAIPDVPAISETLPGFGADLWVALFAPRGTPQVLRDRLHGAVLRAMQDDAFKAKMLAQGATIVTSTPEELAVLLRADLVKWAEVVKAAGARVE